MLKAKYLTDVSTVHSAFKKYVDHMKQDHESDQKQKLSYLLAYVQLCANVLDEDASTHPARTLDELEKVNKYVVRIVLPYLKKLKTEKDRRTSGGSNTPQSGGGGGLSMHNPTNTGNNTSNMGAFEAMMGMRSNGSHPHQQQQHHQQHQQHHQQQHQQHHQQQQNHFQSMMQASVPKQQQQQHPPPLASSSQGNLLLDEYNMGGSGGGGSLAAPPPSNMSQYYPQANMGYGYGGGGGTSSSNDDMMAGLQGGSTDMNFLDMDGTSFGMGDAQGGGGGGSSGEDGDGGDLMNIVEAL
ncbi:hypothetical protein DYB37_010568 [Aphanomyces astaci]|uniref:Uncharacterized protein n=1 Tax=Aphanomyces astaci TaxID=112090 RepID=A0A3R6YEK6_APHAT|nr:hypothetical protein DYB37_010568 [Aphanomyces astaci]